MRIRLALGLCAACLAVLGCMEPSIVRDGVRVSVRDAVETDVAEARTARENGQPKEAQRILERTLAEVPDTEHNDLVLYELGEVYLELDEPDRALGAWRRLIDRHDRSPLAPQARLRMAEVYRSRGRLGMARRVLADARFESASDSLRLEMYRTLADLAREEEDFAETVRWLAFARRDAAAPGQVVEIDLEIQELLQDRLSDAELSYLLPLLPPGPAHDRAALEYARRSLDSGNVDAALEALDSLPRRLRPSDEAERQELLARAQLGATASSRTIGLALPLSGTFARFGTTVLRGVVLGFEVLEDPPRPYTLVVRDTRGEPQRAAEVVQELADAGVAAIIGPLRSASAAAAAPRAQAAGVPLLSLARRDDLPYLGDSIFRLGLTRGDQVNALLDYAFRVGSQRFGILYPRDDFGTSFKNLFWEEVERRGGEVVGVEGYAPGSPDIQNEIKKLVGLYYLTPHERDLVALRDRLARYPVENAEQLADPNLAELPPHVDFDALFVPEEAAQVGLILPQLRFYDIVDVVLLGSSGWNDPTLVEIAGRDARGAVFTDVFFPESRAPIVRDFVSRYVSAYGESPDYLAAEGFDAAALLHSLMDGRRSVTREGLRRSILSVHDFEGVSGVASFDEVGGVHKELHLLTIQRGRIDELESVTSDPQR